MIAAARALVGERSLIFEGTPLGFTEAPHLYRRGGYYYLITAEGGTQWNHAVTMARSKNLLGPYELHPDTYILSSRDRPDAPLQRAGHADLVETPDGRDLDGLSVRPAAPQSRPLRDGPRDRDPAHALGRGWLALHVGRRAACRRSKARAELPPRHPAAPERDDFDGPDSADRLPVAAHARARDDLQPAARPGHLRLYGRETIGSLFTQALVARRQQAFCYSRRDPVEFDPAHYQQAAGLVCYYNGAKFHYFHVSHDEEVGRHIRVMSALPDSPMADAFTAPIPIPGRADRIAGRGRL